MKNFKTTLLQATMAGSILAAAALCAAQTTTTVSAQYGTAPASGQNFTIDLVNSPATDIAGFSFKLLYDPNQVDVTGVSDNTGQSQASVQYTLGKATDSSNAAMPAQRIVMATTLKELKGAGNLVELKLVKKPGFAPPLKFAVEDRVTGKFIDGLQGADLKNVPHEFDASAVNK
jgi:hypothetical protein